MGYHVKLECHLCVATGLFQQFEASLAENLYEKRLLFVEPGNGGETAGGAVDGSVLVLLKDDGDETGEETLDEIENIVDWRADLPDGVENVAVEDHLPLDPTIRGEEGTGMHGQLELELWPCG